VFGERSSVGERARIVANLEDLDMDLTREAPNGLTFWPRVVAPDVEKLCIPNERRSRERGQQKEKTVSGCRNCQQPLDAKMCKCGTNVQRTEALARNHVGTYRPNWFLMLHWKRKCTCSDWRDCKQIIHIKRMVSGQSALLALGAIISGPPCSMENRVERRMK
jgi:hypothetical protein